MSELNLRARLPLDELARALNHLGRNHRIDNVFTDWIETCALAISNKVDRHNYDVREARYMSIVGKYPKEDIGLFAQMFGMLVSALEFGADAPLQELMSKLELGSLGAKKRMGQYFTPWHVSLMMAKMTLAPADKLAEQIKEKGFITMMEPACGAGGMILAFARALEDEGFNFQKHLHVMAVDIDPMCVHMAYVQTALIGIPAIIVRGDSLRATASEHWYTPLHVLGGWDGRLRAKSEREASEAHDAKEDAQALLRQLEAIMPEETPAPVPEPSPEPTPPALPAVAPGITRWRISADGLGSMFPAP